MPAAFWFAFEVAGIVWAGFVIWAYRSDTHVLRVLERSYGRPPTVAEVRAYHDHRVPAAVVRRR